MYSILGRGSCFNYCLNSAWHGGDPFVALLRWYGGISCFSFSSWQYLIDSLWSGLVSLLASQAHQHHGEKSRLALNRGSRLDFTPCPTLFFLPACFCCLVSSIYWRDSFCTALQTRKLWIWSTGLSARLTPSSQREVWVLGNLFVLTGRSRPDIRGMHGRSGKSCLAALSVEDAEDIYLFGTMITGILLIGLGFTLGYRKIQKTGTAVQSLTRLPVLIEAVGRAVSNETETINRNMDTIMMKLAALKVKLDVFRDQNGQREWAAVVCSCSPQSHNNLILSFLAPRTGALAKAVWITTLRERWSGTLFLPSPTTDITPLPHSTASVTLCTATRASRSATGAVINGTGPDGCLPELDMFPLLQCHVFMVYVLLCCGVFFSVLRLYSKWSIVWGLNFFSLLSLLM